MSKVPHLLPRHLRNAAIREMTLPKRVRQRKRRKDLKRKQHRKEFIVKLHDLPSLNNDQEKKSFRLSTHLYHAKRMKMDDRWGFRIAVEHITDKIFRNGYRYMRRHCTLHERSYMVCLQIEFSSSGNVEKLLKSMMQIHQESQLPFHEDYLIGKREGTFEWLDDSNFTISPVDFLVKPSESANCANTIMIWLHPSTLPESYHHLTDIVTKLNGKVHHRNDLSRFEIRGPLTMKTISNVIRIHIEDTINELRQRNGSDSAIKSIVNEWERMKTDIQMATSLPSDMVLGFMAKHPIYTSSFNSTFEDYKRESRLLANAVTPNTSYTSPNHEENLNALQKKIMVNIPNQLNDIGLIWSHSECKERYHFPYLRKNKRTKKLYTQGAEGPRSFPVILIQKTSSLNSGSTMGGGFDIILPTVDVSAHVWSKLSEQKNTMVLPLLDRNRLLLEQGKRVFPDDYPSSQAFQRMAIEKEESMETLIQNLSCPLPSFRSIHIFGIWGGSLAPFDTIHLPTNPTQIKELLKRAKPKSKKGELDTKMHAIHNSLIDTTCIGFVTSANYSLLRGKKFGIGFITANSSQQLPFIPGHHQNLILIKRKEKSNEYFYPFQVAVTSK